MEQSQKRQVSNLSTEQLYRKRALDRENQRALRHKKKAQLEELEKSVKELQEKLQRSEVDRATLEARDTNVRKTLSAILPSLQLLQIGNAQDTDLPTVSTNIAPSIVHGHQAAQNVAVSEPSQAQPAEWWNSSVVLPAPSGALATDFANWSGLDLDDSLLMSSTIRMSDLDDFSFTLGNITSLPSPPLPPEDNDRTNEVFAPPQELLQLNRIQANQLRSSRPIWAITPTFTPPTSRVDNLILSIIASNETQIDRSAKHAEEFTARSFPSIMSLLNPSDPTSSTSHPVSSTIAKHVARVVTVPTFPEKLALLYVMCLLVRWQICPTQSNYEALPAHFHPSGLQLARPYPFWVSTIAWPGAREQIMQHMDFTQYDVFARTINKTFSVNWNQGLAAILQGDDDSDFVLSARYVEHIRDLKNWTVGRELVEVFPFLDGVVNCV